jgi:hypothetical protein
MLGCRIRLVEEVRVVLGGTIRRGYLAVWLLLIVAVVVPTAVRLATWQPDQPYITVVGADGHTHRVTLTEMKELPVVLRFGEAQNQFGNWRDDGTYTGALVTDILTAVGERAADLQIAASDGYHVLLDASRLADPAYPVVLAYAKDGSEVPDWQDGFRLVVLPEDGAVSNEEYDAESAGSYWVKNVERVTVEP